MSLLAALLLAQGPAEGIGIDQRLDARVDLDLRFRDESGRPARLGDLGDGRPLVLAPVYYKCPLLCSQVLNGLAKSLKPVDLRPGEAFDVVAFSIDPRETPATAVEAKAALLRRYGRPETAAGWHFLTGDAAAALAEQIGFRYRYDAASGLYAHAGGIMVLTPDGRLARYFYGIEYPSRDLRLSLVEAAEGRIGTLADRVLLLCLRWDPSTGRYTWAALGVMRIGGVLTLLAIGAWFARAVGSRRRRRAP